MQITGQLANAEETGVHTIDVWYSERRRLWIIERLDAEGHLVGAPHHCRSRADAVACVAEWLRAHGETSLVAHLPPRARPSNRAAA